MQYKSEYGPSELLDSATLKWLDLRAITPMLNAGFRMHFHQPHTNTQAKVTLPSNVSDAVTSAHLPRPLPPGISDPDSLKETAEDYLVLVMEDGPATLMTLRVRKIFNGLLSGKDACKFTEKSNIGLMFNFFAALHPMQRNRFAAVLSSGE